MEFYFYRTSEEKNSDYRCQLKGGVPVQGVHICGWTVLLHSVVAVPKPLPFLLFQDIRRNLSLWLFITSG